MYCTPGSGREAGCFGSVTSTTWPVGPVPTKTWPSGRTASASACVSGASYASVQGASSLPSWRKTLPASPVAAIDHALRRAGQVPDAAASSFAVGLKSCPSRTRPLSEMTTRSRCPLPNAEDVSCRQVSSFARADGARARAKETTPSMRTLPGRCLRLGHRRTRWRRGLQVQARLRGGIGLSGRGPQWHGGRVRIHPCPFIRARFQRGRSPRP